MVSKIGSFFSNCYCCCGAPSEEDSDAVLAQYKSVSKQLSVITERKEAVAKLVPKAVRDDIDAQIEAISRQLMAEKKQN